VDAPVKEVDVAQWTTTCMIETRVAYGRYIFGTLKIVTRTLGVCSAKSSFLTGHKSFCAQKCKPKHIRIWPMWESMVEE
jgi:hypothetical protein